MDLVEAVETRKPAPKSPATVFVLVAREIDRNAHQPGSQAGFAPEAGAFYEGSQEAFLREHLGCVRISHKTQ